MGCKTTTIISATVVAGLALAAIGGSIALVVHKKRHRQAGYNRKVTKGRRAKISTTSSH